MPVVEVELEAEIGEDEIDKDSETDELALQYLAELKDEADEYPDLLHWLWAYLTVELVEKGRCTRDESIEYVREGF